jgi:hypothetical protein
MVLHYIHNGYHVVRKKQRILKSDRTCDCTTQHTIKPHPHPRNAAATFYSPSRSTPSPSRRRTRPETHQNGRSHCLFRHLSSGASNTALYRRITTGLVKLIRKDAQSPGRNARGQTGDKRWTLSGYSALQFGCASGTVCGKSSAWREVAVASKRGGVVSVKFWMVGNGRKGGKAAGNGDVPVDQGAQ